MQIFPVYLDLSKDKNWRNRVVCLEILRMLEKELGVDFVNDRQILKLLMDRLSDKVYSVRMAAIKTLKNLSKKLGSSWADKKALPILKSFMQNPNFLFRINYHFGVKVPPPTNP